MAKIKNHTGLIASIIVAGVLVSGALIFVGLRGGLSCLSEDELKTAVIDGFTELVSGPQEEEAAEPSQPERVSGDFSDDDPYKGDDDASVLIVEFSDYECPYCSKFVMETLPLIQEKYIDKGDVKFVYRDFPIDGHAGAMPAAVAAECTREQLGDEGYFEMHDLIFEDQGVLSGDAAAGLRNLALSLGLDEGDYDTCVASGKYEEEARADREAALSVGISGTPSFLINGRILKGAYPFSEFEKIIEEELNN